MDSDKTADVVLLYCFLFLLVFPLLYIFRSLDDNVLTSWRWVFSGGGIGTVFPCLLIGLLVSFYLSKSSWPQRHPQWFLFFVSLAAVLPLWKTPEVIIDVSRYFTQAKHLELYGAGYFFEEWGKEISAWTDLPVAPFFYGLIFRFFGESRLYIQLFNSILFSLTVLTAFHIGKKLWDEEIGFFAGLLLLGIPYLPTQVPLMLVDIPAMFLFTFSVFAFINALDRGGIGWTAISIVSIFLAVFTKYSLLPMFLIIPLVAFIRAEKGIKASLGRLALVAGVSGLLSLALFFTKYDVFVEQIALLRSYQWPGLGRWHESHISTFLFQTHPFVSAFSVYAVYLAAWKRDKKFLVAAWFFVFIFLIGVQRIRYILPMFPLFTLAAAYGLSGLKDKQVRRFIGYATTASSLALVYFAFAPFLNSVSTVNLRNAGAYINKLGCSEVEVVTLPQDSSTANTEVALPMLDLYTDKKLIMISNPASTREKDEESIKVSPLRFTWDFKFDRLYTPAELADNLPIAVISSVRIVEPPAVRAERMQNYPLFKEFTVQSKVFKFKTFVTIFGNDCG